MMPESIDQPSWPIANSHKIPLPAGFLPWSAGTVAELTLSLIREFPPAIENMKKRIKIVGMQKTVR